MVAGVRGHGWMDGGVGRWRGDSPREIERERERGRVGAPGEDLSDH